MISNSIEYYNVDPEEKGENIDQGVDRGHVNFEVDEGHSDSEGERSYVDIYD